MSTTKNPSGSKSSEIDRVGRTRVPVDYFVYAGESETEGSVLYRCLHCAAGAQGKKFRLATSQDLI